MTEKDQINTLNLSQRILNSNFEFCNTKLMVFYEYIARDQALSLDNNTQVVQQRLKDQEKKGKLKHGDHLVQCTFLDGRRQFMQNKIDHLRCKCLYSSKTEFEENFQ